MTQRAVLVVDSDRKVRAAVKALLRPEGCRVFEAASGLEALAVCACRSVDLVLTELDLAGIRGEALAEAIRERFPAVVVIALSANIPDHPLGQISGFLVKPLEAEALLASVRHWLEAPPKKQAASAVASAHWLRKQG